MQATPADQHRAASADARRRWTLPLWLQRLALFLGLMLAWEAASHNWFAPEFGGRPSIFIARFVSSIADGQLLYHTYVTASEMLTGLLLGTASAIVAALLLGSGGRVGDLFRPYFVGLYALPKITIAPLLILWLGIGFGSKVTLVWLSTFLFIFFALDAGLRNPPRKQIEQAKVMGASAFQIALKVLLPSSMVWVFNGLKVAVPYSLLAALGSEMVASTKGVGFLILQASQVADTNGVFAYLIMIVLLTLLINAALGQFKRWALRWQA
jgi:NitT/TauT family transport system permease protein